MELLSKQEAAAAERSKHKPSLCTFVFINCSMRNKSGFLALNLAERHVDVKNEKSYGDGGYDHQEIIHGANCCSSWSQVLQHVSSPNSCLTTSFNSNIPDFSKRSVSSQPDQHSSEYNNRTSSVALKKAKIQPSSTDQSSLKVDHLFKH